MFHFNVTGFSGGFVGVDVFFVISGFLMTGIVVRALENGRFSLWGFYLARAKRILPALLALLAVLLILGYFFLLPPDYRVLGTHSFYSILFFTNVKFWQEAGYFDSASHEKWLLHTWSLSAEWQFYLVLPIVLLLAWRLHPARSTLFWVCTGLLGLSLAASVVVTARDASGAFFLLHTRAWEMLAGGLVALLGQCFTAQGKGARLAAWVGLGLIGGSTVAFSSVTPWPGWRALFPVVGAMLVLAANCPLVLTSHRVAQWLGDRSYSIYLWHWPVVVALAYAGLQHQVVPLACGVLLSVVLGALSYTLIEQPSRHALGQLQPGRVALAIGVGAVLAAVPAFAVWQAGGITGRFPAAVELAAEGAQDFHPDRARCHGRTGNTSPGCIFGAAQRDAIVIGDSHVAGVVSAIAAAGHAAGKGVQQWSYDGCIYVPAMRQVAPDRFSKGANCHGFNAWVTGQLQEVPREVPVILVGRYARYAMGPNESGAVTGTPEVYFDNAVATQATPAFLQRFREEIVNSACALARQRPVYMMRPVPEMPVHVPQYISRRMAWGMDPGLSVSMAEYQARNRWVWEAQDEAKRRCGIRILNPLPALCAGGRCTASLNDRPLFYDHGHMSEYGNKLLVPMFMEVFGVTHMAAAQP